MQKTLAHGESQILLPESFVALFVPPGKIKPTEPYEVIAQRHELCEDMAQLLTEQAAQLQFKLGVQPPIRESGDLANTPGIRLEGPAGTERLDPTRGLNRSRGRGVLNRS